MEQPEGVIACGAPHPSGGTCVLPAGHAGPHSLYDPGAPVPWNVPLADQPVGRIDRTAAAALAIFGGSFGLHKFYRGQTGLGVLYLLFFWAYIPAILGMIEGISYLITSEEKWAAQYGGPPGHESQMVNGCLLVVAGLVVLALVSVIGLLVTGAGFATFPAGSRT